MRLSARRWQRSLVVFQFVLSLVVFIAALVIAGQVRFMLGKDLGIDKEKVAYLYLSNDAVAQFESLRNVLLNTPGVESVSRGNQVPLQIRNTFPLQLEGAGPDDWVNSDVMSVDYNVVETLGLRITDGHDFRPEFAPDGLGILINQSLRQLVAMMTGSFLRLILLAFVIAAPLAWYLMSQWLQGFAYRIDLDVWTFVAAGAATLAIAWLTVFWQCLRAAMVNPVEVLKYE